MVPNAHGITKFAIDAIGIEEVPRGSNDGKALRALLARTRFEPGQAWCMFFAIACLTDTLPDNTALPGWLNSNGSCHDAAMTARSWGRLSKDAATGCIMLLKGGPRGWHHAGIVIATRDGGREVHTVEGNTNSDGSVNGYTVCRHVRKAEACDFIIWEKWP